MSLLFDPAALVWNRFDGLETPDPKWKNDIEYWETFNKAFFAANGRDYDPVRHSNVAHWVATPDRASFTDMIAALAPRLPRTALEDVGMVILAHWLPDLHLGSSATNFAMHHLGIRDALGFAVSDRGLSAPLFAFDFAERAISAGRCRKILLLIMDQKTMLYRDPDIADLAPENVAAALVIGGAASGLRYRGYARRPGVAQPDLPGAIAAVSSEFGLSDPTIIGPDWLAPDIPGAIPVDPTLVSAAPFIAMSQAPKARDTLIVTSQFGTLTALGFATEGTEDAS